MKIRIETKVSKDSQNYAGSSSVSQVSHSESFSANSYKSDEYTIKNSEASTWSIALTDICEDVSKINSIVAFCGTQVAAPADMQSPVRFDIVVGNSVIQLSHIAISNCTESQFEDMMFSNFDIPAGKNAVLTLSISYR
jgi:hypothetical protein